jgi:hypothetical protein
VTVRRAAAVLLAVLLPALAGCGASGGGGTATLWVTRDRGAHVLVDAKVRAGQTILRALRSQADVETRYGGRYVQAIDGVEGSLSAQRDWFWFVNGLAGDRSAAEYRVRDGDVVWWDYRDWGADAELPVVVGAFPEPFLHGYGGKTRPAAVVYALPSQRAAARRVARRIHAARVQRAGAPVPGDWNVFVLERPGGQPRFTARQRHSGGPGSPVELRFAGDVSKLLASGYRRRFAVP